MDIGELYNEYFDDCLQFACSLTREVSQAEDLTQTAFTRAMSSLQLLTILSESQRKSWLFTVVKNLFLDEQRKEKTHQAWATNTRKFAEPDDPFDEQIRRWDLERYLSQLSEQQRDILVKRYWLNLNSREIGQALDMPPATVRYHLSEALKRLKTLYREEEDHEQETYRQHWDPRFTRNPARGAGQY
jgi:RNA polymerase sigma-70 factor (ECF subfamily)